MWLQYIEKLPGIGQKQLRSNVFIAINSISKCFSCSNLKPNTFSITMNCFSLETG